METIPDIQSVEVDHQLVGNGVDRAVQLDAVANYIEDATAPEARRHLRVYKYYRHGDPDLCISAHSHKIDM